MITEVSANHESSQPLGLGCSEGLGLAPDGFAIGRRATRARRAPSVRLAPLTRWARLAGQIFPALALMACGGGDYIPLPAAQAQTAPAFDSFTLHAIVRPDEAGRWFVQNDADHAPRGIATTIEQGTDQRGPYVRVFFDRTYSHAGAITITTDDDFGPSVSAHSNLGLNHATIRVFVGGKMVDPATVRPVAGGGNLWITAQMQHRR
jgi:hypothetical protein